MFALQPIGVARTPFSTTRSIPRQGAGPAQIEVFPDFAPALVGIDQCSHLWVLAYFDEADRSILQARPRNAPGDAPPHGVFAMRAPVRPNPIGLSAVRLLARHNTTLTVDRLDCRDNTPVVDLKPYSPGWDLIPSALSVHRYDPSRYAPDEIRDALWRDAHNALGLCADQMAVVGELIDALCQLALDAAIDIRDTGTRFAIDAADARVDVLLCATGASFGNRRLSLMGREPDVVLRVWTRDQRWGVCRPMGEQAPLSSQLRLREEPASSPSRSG
ncbi:MAG: tRNA (N6-threonylcarbamoyladenosine(37)-N6)-methyltransferase TrmO [Polyangiaceae bacterium]|jgi:tRNA-Thr(GGU) m(6)t(6)A37 methyltransferase TsaA|nr:tRNA (N6-threonylcarbamoyladenosine(37)-N6)-methyltransferase TrmO [Polyangiaceae bacterium]